MPLNHISIYSELTEEHFVAIGKIVVEWSNIEHSLGILLSRLLIVPELLSMSYSTRLSAAKLQDAIKEAIQIHKNRYAYKLIPESTLNSITEINNKITTIRSTRNKFAHFCWSRSSDNEIFGTNFSNKNNNYITFTVSELTKFYNESYKLVDDLSSVLTLLPVMEEEGISKKLKWPDSHK